MRYNMKNAVCGFITCRFEDRLLIEKEVRGSCLTYVQVSISFEELGKGGVMYGVVNNRFSSGDFKKLMLFWREKFDQTQILITEPDGERDRYGHFKFGAEISVKGYSYGPDGERNQIFNNVTDDDIKEFFTEIIGEPFQVNSVSVNETKGYDIYSVAGHVLGLRDFKVLYPELSEKKIV